MNKKFCYLNPPFRRNLYIALVFTKTKDDFNLLYPMTETYNNIKELAKDVKIFRKELKTNSKATLYGTVVVSLKLHKKFLNKEEYWTSTKEPDINKNLRINSYLEMMKGIHAFYQVLIVPRQYNDKTKVWTFTNWMPISIASTDEQIDSLIKLSDQPVDIRAKYTGIYLIKEVKGFDIDTAKFIEPKQENINFESNC